MLEWWIITKSYVTGWQRYTREFKYSQERHWTFSCSLACLPSIFTIAEKELSKSLKAHKSLLANWIFCAVKASCLSRAINETTLFVQMYPDAGKGWGQEEKRSTEDEMVGWHYWLNRHEVWANCGRSRRTGKPGMLQSMESQRVRHNLATEQWKHIF